MVQCCVVAYITQTIGTDAAKKLLTQLYHICTLD